jgi:hypothetical protein
MNDPPPTPLHRRLRPRAVADPAGWEPRPKSAVGRGRDTRRKGEAPSDLAEPTRTHVMLTYRTLARWNPETTNKPFNMSQFKTFFNMGVFRDFRNHKHMVQTVLDFPNLPKICFG